MTVDTKEQPKRPNPDYSNVALNLCNPDAVLQLLVEKATHESHLEHLKTELKDNPIYQELMATEEYLRERAGEIREAIEQHGSYQDIDAGVYAVKYAKKSRAYHVEPFKERFPKLVNAVVEEAINVKALAGLVKGGLIKEDELLNPLMMDGQPVITETESYAFYIR